MSNLNQISALDAASPGNDSHTIHLRGPSQFFLTVTAEVATNGAFTVQHSKDGTSGWDDIAPYGFTAAKQTDSSRYIYPYVLPYVRVRSNGTSGGTVTATLEVNRKGNYPVSEDVLPGEDAAASAATGTLTLTGTGTAADEVVIGDATYTLVDSFTTPAEANEVAIGADAAGTAANLIAAIMASGTAGTEYSEGTVVHPDVTAAEGSTAGEVDLTAKVAGTTANSIATTTTSSAGSFGSATLTGGSNSSFASFAGPIVDKFLRYAFTE